MPSCKQSPFYCEIIATEKSSLLNQSSMLHCPATTTCLQLPVCHGAARGRIHLLQLPATWDQLGFHLQPVFICIVHVQQGPVVELPYKWHGKEHSGVGYAPLQCAVLSCRQWWTQFRLGLMANVSKEGQCKDNEHFFYFPGRNWGCFTTQSAAQPRGVWGGLKVHPVDSLRRTDNREKTTKGNSLDIQIKKRHQRHRILGTEERT